MNAPGSMVMDTPAPGARAEIRATGIPAPRRTDPGRGWTDTSWGVHLRAAEQALDRGDVPHAFRAWEKAHLAAVQSATWEGLIETGRTSLRIGRLGQGGRANESTARRAFFTALYRACRANSFEGIVCSADAFRVLGDREVVDECLGLAQLLAEGEEPRRRLAELLERSWGPGGSDPGGVTS